MRHVADLVVGAGMPSINPYDYLAAAASGALGAVFSKAGGDVDQATDVARSEARKLEKEAERKINEAEKKMKRQKREIRAARKKAEEAERRATVAEAEARRIDWKLPAAAAAGLLVALVIRR